MTISCVRHPSTGPAQPNGANAPTKIPGPKSDARPYKQDRVHGFLAHALHGVHHIRALAQHGIAERLRRPGIPGHHVEHGWKRDQRQHAGIERKIVLVHGSGQFIGAQITVPGSPRRPRRVSRSRKWNRLKPGPATGRDRARCARSCHPVAAARAAAPAAVDIPAAAGGGGPCASTATHNTLAIALAQQSSFHHRNNPILVRTGQEAWPTGASRVPHTRGPHRTRFQGPNNKGTHTHTHTHRHTDTNTGRHTDTGSHSRNTPRWAVWCGLAHHMAARNRLDSPSGTLAAPPRWRP